MAHCLNYKLAVIRHYAGLNQRRTAIVAGQQQNVASSLDKATMGAVLNRDFANGAPLPLWLASVHATLAQSPFVMRRLVPVFVNDVRTKQFQRCEKALTEENTIWLLNNRRKVGEAA